MKKKQSAVPMKPMLIAYAKIIKILKPLSDEQRARVLNAAIGFLFP